MFDLVSLIQQPAEVQAVSGVVQAIAGILQALAAIFMFFVAIPQLKSLAFHSNTEVLNLMVTEVGASEIREIRKRIYNTDLRALDDLDKLTDLQKEDIQKIKDDIRKLAVAYDRISFVLLNDKRIRETFYEFQGKEIIDLWKKIKPFIKQIRVTRGNTYCWHFERLAGEYRRLKAVRKLAKRRIAKRKKYWRYIENFTNKFRYLKKINRKLQRKHYMAGS